MKRQLIITALSLATVACVAQNKVNGHEYVDLGLSVKWATCNIGAAKASDYGDYIAWGETGTKTSYTVENCATSGKDVSDFAGNATYDAARKNWGGAWRMPTYTEMKELTDKCQWEWTTQGGHKGYKVTGPNGNSIFLPAPGYIIDQECQFQEDYGGYWTSTPCDKSKDPQLANCWRLYFRGSGNIHRVGFRFRDRGRSIRPVIQ